MKIKNIFCINLNYRTDRRKKILKQCKKMKLKINFFTSELHSSIDTGILNNHLQILKTNKNLPFISIIYDNVLFLKQLEIPTPPDNWDIIYLEQVSNVKHYNSHYNKVNTLINLPCYLIRNKCAEKVVNSLEYYTKTLLDFHNELLDKFNCFSLKVPIIKRGETLLDFQIKKIPIADHIIHDDKFILKNDENIILPKVSLITPTRNRSKFFKMVIHNFNNFNYPKDLLEWIIIDDDDAENITDILPKQDNIIYIRDKFKGITDKRNYGCNLATGEYIMNFDDDDIYFPESIIDRIKTLILQDKHCIGCCKIACLENKRGFYVGSTSSPYCEATMIYKKTFWEERNFDNNIKQGEGVLFVKDREEQCIQIPWYFVSIVINHNLNYTKKLRNDNTNTNSYELFYKLDDFYKTFLNNLCK